MKLTPVKDQDLYNRQLNSDGESVLCGQQVKITLVSDKTKSVTVTVADDCPTCQNTNSIDLSLAAFQKLASLDKGDVAISWEFVNN
jgi:expansin (peptidoglycan-binding protein)